MNLEPGSHEVEQPAERVVTNLEWVAIRDECASGGELNDLCNLVRAIHGAEIEVVAKRLSCGCWLVPETVVENGDVLL